LSIGLGQLINWGVLYYAFGVLLVPIEMALQVPQWVVAGAFSLSLAISAGCAPTIGRWIDRGHGPAAMIWGGVAAALLLAIWAAIPNLTTLYIVWTALGACMAATLYEPAFAIVGRSFPQLTDRLRALALVTMFGGLASTVFLPLIAVLVTRVGWRGAVLALAMAMLLSTALVWWFVPADDHLLEEHGEPAGPVEEASPPPRGFAVVLAAFASTSFAHAALTTTLVAALAERGLSTTTAAFLGSFMGVMQLPGRALMMHGRLAASPGVLLIVSLALLGAGLLVLTGAGSAMLIGVGFALFAGGAGLATLVRPYLVQTEFSLARAGYLNGLLARAQQLARAAAPILAVTIGSTIGYRWLYGLLALQFAGLAYAWRRSSRKTGYP
jgi:hypothetical protein